MAIQTSTEECIERFRNEFESHDRYEYCVYDEDILVAIMVIVEDVDIISGMKIVNSLHTFSLKPNLLSGAYRFMKCIGKRIGCKYMVISRMGNDGFTSNARLVKI